MTRNQIDYWNLQENSRHNVVTEKETGRHNLATEQETARSNMAREVETGRHNRATESIDLGKLQEQSRHNRVSEGQEDTRLSIESGKLVETGRHNLETEAQGRVNLGLSSDTLAELRRHNKATESLTGTDLNIKSMSQQETMRHNLTSESIEQQKAESQYLVNKANADYTNLKAKWEDVKTTEGLNLTRKQVEEMDARIEKYAQDIAKSNSDITRNNFQNANDTARTVISGLDTINDIIQDYATIQPKG